MDNNFQIPGQVEMSASENNGGFRKHLFQTQYSYQYEDLDFNQSVQVLINKLEIIVKMHMSICGGKFKILDENETSLFDVKRERHTICTCCCGGHESDVKANEDCCHDSMTFHVVDPMEKEVIRIERNVENSCCGPAMQEVDFFLTPNIKLASYNIKGSLSGNADITNQTGDRLLSTESHSDCCDTTVMIKDTSDTEIGKMTYPGSKLKLDLFKHVPLREKIGLLGIAIMAASDKEDADNSD